MAHALLSRLASVAKFVTIPGAILVGHLYNKPLYWTQMRSWVIALLIHLCTHMNMQSNKLLFSLNSYYILMILQRLFSLHSYCFGFLQRVMVSYEMWCFMHKCITHALYNVLINDFNWSIFYSNTTWKIDMICMICSMLLVAILSNHIE